MNAAARTEAEALARQAVRDPQVLTRHRDRLVLGAAAHRAQALARAPLGLIAAASLVTLALVLLCLEVRLFPEGTGHWAVPVILATVLVACVQSFGRCRNAEAAIDRAWRGGRDGHGLIRLGTINLEVDTWFDQDGDVVARGVAVRGHDLDAADVARLANRFVESTYRVEGAILAAYAGGRERLATATVLVDLSISRAGEELVAERATVTGHRDLVFHTGHGPADVYDGDLPDLVDHALADLGENVR